MSLRLGAPGPRHARQVCAQVVDWHADPPLREARVDKDSRPDRFGHYTLDRKFQRIDLTPLGMDLVLRRLRALPVVLLAHLLPVHSACCLATPCLPDVPVCSSRCQCGPSCCRSPNGELLRHAWGAGYAFASAAVDQGCSRR